MPALPNPGRLNVAATKAAFPTETANMDVGMGEAHGPVNPQP